MAFDRIFVNRLSAAVLTGLVFMALGGAWKRQNADIAAGERNSIRRAVPVGPSCPLTTSQQKKSVAAWKQLMPVFRHPRCSNCHGNTPDPFPADGEPPKRHMGVIDVQASFRNSSTPYCENCHMKGWHQPGVFLFWTNKTDAEICSSMKQKFAAPAFIDHIERDGGGVPFIETAFIGERGLDDSGQGLYEAETDKKFVAEPPPGSHAEFIANARGWVQAQGGQFVGDADCGCVVKPKGETYSLWIDLKLDNAFNGFLIQDSVKMSVNVDDTVVTVSDIINYPPGSTPERIPNPTGYVIFKDDPIGDVNVVTATGILSVDYPTDGDRTLKIDFTHLLPTAPAFWIVRTIKPTGRQKTGGEADVGFPNSVMFVLKPGKTSYDNGPDPKRPLMTRLTLVSKTK
jgi:hypothetical protein